MNLNNKNTIVTGASSGLGAATSRLLVENGATVYGIGRNNDKLATLQKELGNHFIPIVLDVSKEKNCTDWVNSTFSATTVPSVLINNAGVSQFKEVDKLESYEWNQMVNVNLNAVHHFTSSVVPFMKKDESISHIINIGSILGKVSGSNKSAYSATKFAIQGYSEALFKELRSFNIKVSCLNPGSINTQFFSSSGITPSHKMLQPKDLAEIVIFMLQTPDNVLIDELSVRPLKPK